MDRIRNQSMTRATASKIKDELNPNVAFKSRSEYIDSLAALAKLFPKEVKKKPFGSKRKLKDILASSCEPGRLEFMFNESRFVRTLTEQEQDLFQSGVCGNEAFHLETKNTFNNMSLHPAVLDMKLEHLQTSKLLAHNSTLYHTAICQMDEQEVLYRRVASVQTLTSESKWANWCNSQTPGRGNVPLRGQQKKAQVTRLAKWAAQQRAAAMKAMKVMKSMKARRVMKTSIFRRGRNAKLLQK